MFLQPFRRERVSIHLIQMKKKTIQMVSNSKILTMDGNENVVEQQLPLLLNLISPSLSHQSLWGCLCEGHYRLCKPSEH